MLTCSSIVMQCASNFIIQVFAKIVVLEYIYESLTNLHMLWCDCSIRVFSYFLNVIGIFKNHSAFHTQDEYDS